jgi:Holliday junction resolvase RusA-like endonuclease
MAAFKVSASEFKELEKKYGPGKGINLAALAQADTKRVILPDAITQRPVSVGRWQVVLPLPPRLSDLFINKKKGKGRFVSPEYKVWKEKAAQALTLMGAVTPPVYVRIIIRPGKGWISTSDIANREKAVTDALVDGGIIPDDNCQYVHKVTMEFRPLPARPKGIPPVAIVLITPCPIALVPLGQLPDDPILE